MLKPSESHHPKTTNQALLQVSGLEVSIHTGAQHLTVVDDVSFNIEAGKTLGLVGESGSGKSVTALSLMRLLPYPHGRITKGSIFLDGLNIPEASLKELYHLRGNSVSMIFQEPMTALNPVHRIGKQLAEMFELHRPDISRRDVQKACCDLLSHVGIPSPDQRINEYPHQLSGGMKQRVMIAMALACRPKLLIADEPTTALDVTTQAQILELMRDMQKDLGMAILFITHDLGVVAQMCDDVAVMYAGKIMESAPIMPAFKTPKHPYTQGLLNSIPSLNLTPKTLLQTIEGAPPNLAHLPSGCRFYDRCIHSKKACQEKPPTLETVSEGKFENVRTHEVRCIQWQEIKYP